MKIDFILQANFWNKSPSILIKLDNKIIKNFDDFVDKQKTNISVDTDIEEEVINKINQTNYDLNIVILLYLWYDEGEIDSKTLKKGGIVRYAVFTGKMKVFLKDNLLLDKREGGFENEDELEKYIKNTYQKY